MWEASGFPTKMIYKWLFFQVLVSLQEGSCEIPFLMGNRQRHAVANVGVQTGTRSCTPNQNVIDPSKCFGKHIGMQYPLL